MNAASRLAVSVMCALNAIAAAAQSSQQQRDQAEAMRQWEAHLQTVIAQSKGHFVCAGIGVMDMGAAIDGPLIYFDDASRRLISRCGGACMLPVTPSQVEMCARLCPPPQWTANACDEKQRVAYLEKLPDLTEGQARANAASFSGCNNPRVRCEMVGRFENSQWIFDISYLSFEDNDMEEWVKRFGKSRVTLGMKGQVIGYRDLMGVEH